MGGTSSSIPPAVVSSLTEKVASRFTGWLCQLYQGREQTWARLWTFTTQPWVEEGPLQGSGDTELRTRGPCTKDKFSPKSSPLPVGLHSNRRKKGSQFHLH